MLPLSILTILRQRFIARQKNLHVIPESYQTASVSNDKYLELIMHKQFIPQEFSTLTAWYRLQNNKYSGGHPKVCVKFKTF